MIPTPINSYQFEDCSQSYHGSTTFNKLTLDRGKRFSTESAFCAKFIVQPSLGNTPTDDLPVEGDGKRTVTVCSDFEEDSLRRLPCCVFPSSAHDEFYKKGCQEKKLPHDRSGDCFSTSSPPWICFAESSCDFPFSSDLFSVGDDAIEFGRAASHGC